MHDPTLEALGSGVVVDDHAYGAHVHVLQRHDENETQEKRREDEEERIKGRGTGRFRRIEGGCCGGGWRRGDRRRPPGVP